MNWTPTDYLFAAALVGIVALVFAAVARRSTSGTYRAAAALALLTAFMLVWANAAVGIIGSEDNPANRLYHALLAVGIVAAALVRGRPRPMARVMAAMAAGLLVIDGIAIVGGLGWAGPLTWLFPALWLLAAWLFRRAAGASVPP